MDSRAVIKLLVADGWYFTKASGSHYQFKHAGKPGKVTVKHPEKDIKPGTLASIIKQAGLD